MEETEYRVTYKAVNECRCVFEKTISSRRSHCSKMLRFHLADREGISCRSAAGNALCTRLLVLMRSNARFALHITHAEGPLPHAREIRVQTGGLLELQALLQPELREADNVADIIALVDCAVERYTSLEALPFDRIVQGIVRFEGRRRRGRDR